MHQKEKRGRLGQRVSKQEKWKAALFDRHSKTTPATGFILHKTHETPCFPIECAPQINWNPIEIVCVSKDKKETIEKWETNWGEARGEVEIWRRLVDAIDWFASRTNDGYEWRSFSLPV
jgi:hypothetical protein